MDTYLTLFHGHVLGASDGHAEDSDPTFTFGPFTHLHGDSKGHFVGHREDGSTAQLFFVETQLFYGGLVFEDWMVFSGRPDMVTDFEQEKATPRRRAGDFAPRRHIS